MRDSRADAADYYDLAPQLPNDIPFYISQIPRVHASVLELGCGTGRVALPLSAHCGFVQGIDSSDAMIRRCETKLAALGIPASQLAVRLADITDYSLGRHFDRIIAPFRVIQNLVSDDEVDALLVRIGEHLEQDGVAILNVFHPNRSPAELIELWSTPTETLEWEVADGQDRIECSVRRTGLTTEPLVLYPDLRYRRVRAGAVIDEAVLSIPMRCYYPAEFVNLVKTRGFEIQSKWGGYAGEAYGSGGELIIAMRRAV